MNLRRMMSDAGPRLLRMQKVLTEKFKPTTLNFDDQSHRHAHHAEMKSGTAGGETHFDLLIVSDSFEGKKLIERHRMVNETISEEFKSGLHALSIKAKTPSEYEKLQSQN